MRPTSSARIALPDRYRVTEHIASGGMAQVWAAHDELLDRPVAVKVLAAHLSEDEAARRRFEREARAAAGLSSHPHVVTIFDVGEADDQSFIVMELLRGGSVADVLRGGGEVHPRAALRWLRDAAEALDAAHEQGIVHRDIKPANLLLDERGRLAVADFGIARLAWESQLTATGQILGTASYLSPEQAAGEPATPASDRYALAVVAYELLTGGRPFQAEHFAAQARAHVEDPPPPPHERNPALPEAVDPVLLRGLAKDPAERWPMATALVDALSAALGEAPATPPPPPTQRTRALGAPAVPATPRRPERAPSGAAPAARPPRRAATPTGLPAARRGGPPQRRAPSPGLRGGGRGRLVAALAVVALLAVAGVVLALVLDGDPERGSTERPRRTPTPAAAAPEQASPEPTPSATATASPEPESQPDRPSGSPTDLNTQGFALLGQQRYDEAIPVLQAAVERCGESRDVDPCGYAHYNLGVALRRGGRPEEAIPVLERRLERFGDNGSKDVRRELKAAQADAGRRPGDRGGEGDDDG